MFEWSDDGDYNYDDNNNRIKFWLKENFKSVEFFDNSNLHFKFTDIADEAFFQLYLNENTKLTN
jgi:hypothetical protein